MNRRAFLRALGAAPIAPRAARSLPSKPNIVILLADDLGYGDLGLTRCPDIRIPNLDRLAREGVQFTHAYANGPVCTPTRVALLTGRYQPRSGLSRVIYVGEREPGLSLDALLLPEALKPQGYATGIMGKWYLGFPTEYFPTRRGFDEFRGHLSGNIDYFEHTDRLGYQDLRRNEEVWRDPRSMTRLIGDESVRFIDDHADAPFRLHVPFNAPNDPFQRPNDRHTAGDQRYTRRRNRTRAVYRSMVESMDENAGRILSRLKQRRLDENTAVFFQRDNGGLPIVARNASFRGFKTTLWEGGLRTPLLARWPGQFPAGQKTADPAIGMDLFTTSLAIAGANVPPGHKLDAVSLLDVCRGRGTLERDTLYFRYQDPRNKTPQRAAVRRGWEYLREEQGRDHLFHLAQDQSEQRNLPGRKQEQFERMRLAYEAGDEEVHRGAPPEPPARLDS